MPCNLLLVPLRQPGKITDIYKLKCSVRNLKEIFTDHDPSKPTPRTDLQGTPVCGETDGVNSTRIKSNNGHLYT